MNLERLHKWSSNIPFSFLSLPWPREATICLVYFVVWVIIGGSFFVHNCCCIDHFSSIQPFEDYFKVVIVQITMMMIPTSDWIPWYVDLGDGRM